MTVYSINGLPLFFITTCAVRRLQYVNSPFKMETPQHTDVIPGDNVRLKSILVSVSVYWFGNGTFLYSQSLLNNTIAALERNGGYFLRKHSRRGHTLSSHRWCANTEMSLIKFNKRLKAHLICWCRLCPYSSSLSRTSPSARFPRSNDDSWKVRTGSGMELHG